MVFRNLVIAVFVFVIFVGGAFTAYQVADLGQKNAPADARNVTNESIVQEYDAYVYTDNATKEFTAGFDDNVTVYNSTNTELTEGTDYEWNATDGTILFLSSSSTTEGNTANITYTYYWNTQEVREVSGPLTTITEGIGRTAFLAGGLGLVVLLLVIAGFAGRRLGSNNLPKSNR